VGAVLVAFLVKQMGSWSAALMSLALIAAVMGPVFWLFVHPERPLKVRS
jgi:cyanate permease